VPAKPKTKTEEAEADMEAFFSSIEAEAPLVAASVAAPPALAPVLASFTPIVVKAPAGPGSGVGVGAGTEAEERLKAIMKARKAGELNASGNGAAASSALQSKSELARVGKWARSLTMESRLSQSRRRRAAN
jgi:hypothetical protein